MPKSPFTPDSFELTPIAEAMQQYHYAIAQSNTHRLDEKTSLWIIRREAWIEIMRAVDYSTHINTDISKNRKELMGIPVRITVDDEPDVPMVQLVMESLLYARR